MLETIVVVREIFLPQHHTRTFFFEDWKAAHLACQRMVFELTSRHYVVDKDETLEAVESVRMQSREVMLGNQRGSIAYVLSVKHERFGLPLDYPKSITAEWET